MSVLVSYFSYNESRIIRTFNRVIRFWGDLALQKRSSMNYLRGGVVCFGLLFLTACGTLPFEDTFIDAPLGDITTQALESSVIDFEGLAEGTIVSQVSAGNGISGFNAGGHVAILGNNPVFPGQNAAMIFDATCDGATNTTEAAARCSGGDRDLWQPSLGNILIISEDLDSSDPDDADVKGEAIDINFSAWGTGVVTIGSVVLNVQDIDEAEDKDAKVTLYNASNAVLVVLPIPLVGNGNMGTVTALINYSGVARMTISLQGSGGIDNIRIATDVPEGGEGCTPGYWKNHTDSWAAAGVSTSATVKSVWSTASAYGVIGDASLLQALSFSGGSGVSGGARILLRAATAAYLNASHLDVSYELSAAQIVSDVNAALASANRATMLSLATQLDELNNAGCPLN
jgi:hypothetical protein